MKSLMPIVMESCKTAIFFCPVVGDAEVGKEGNGADDAWASEHADNLRRNDEDSSYISGTGFDQQS
jgi:hypothetical protein